MGYQLLTSRRYEHLSAERQMAIIYNLLLDQKRKSEQKGIHLDHMLHHSPLSF
jgi:hypothetical protein